MASDNERSCCSLFKNIISEIKKPKQVEALHTSIIIENKIAIIFIVKMKEAI